MDMKILTENLIYDDRVRLRLCQVELPNGAGI